MSEPVKHTPGPWHVIPASSGACGDGGHGCLILSCPTGDPEGAVVCEVDNGLPGRDADAALIAAAPDLLAACEAAEWAMRSHILPEHFDGHAAGAMAVVRAVIARAKGKRPAAG